jgi:hypothetical protein
MCIVKERPPLPLTAVTVNGTPRAAGMALPWNVGHTRA